MRVLSDLSDRLATELAAKGLEAGSARWEEEDSAQTRLLAKWSIDSQSVLQVRVYVADFSARTRSGSASDPRIAVP